MASRTTIEWTEMSWNPVTGCSKCSAGCANCYAERMARRLRSMGNKRYINGFNVTLHPDLLEVPISWKSPKMIFVNSMSDLFHPKVPLYFIKQVFKIMGECSQHIFQLLTKRSERLSEIAPKLTWSDNIWLGVTAENSNVIHRLKDLKKTQADVKFVSCEPLIGPIDRLPLSGIDWLIVGGESGPGARPMKKEWVENIRLQCKRANVPFFFKQWGGVHKKKAGRLLNGNIYDEMPMALYD